MSIKKNVKKYKVLHPLHLTPKKMRKIKKQKEEIKPI